ncbi:MAG: aminoacyl-tRNA hydrolase [Candidatus Latescibacterota bacterium]|nr:MAG: aminoacyl-tRNA hydrolase [Candidatus Latescibacterota bacterium]
MIRVTPTITIEESEIHLEFIRASGPGGQNVNKVSTAVQLRFDVMHSPSLPDEVRERLIRIAGKKMTEDGVLVITARRHRTQGANREDAVNRLVKLIQKASETPRPRRKTKPTPASRKRRLQEKRRRGETKRQRADVRHEDE